MRLFFCLSLIFFASCALAFRTIPEHPDITKQAIKNMGWSLDARMLLAAASIAPDRDDGIEHENSYYRSKHHCDRPTGLKSKTAFIECVKNIKSNRKKALFYARKNYTGEAIASLGRALHALQDVNSHSNLVDLSKDDANKIKDIILHQHNYKQVPKPLKLTGYTPSQKRTFYHLYDFYSHDNYSKDSLFINSEARKKIGKETKFKITYKSAIRMTKQFIKDFEDELGEKKFKVIKRARLYSVFPALPPRCSTKPYSINNWRAELIKCRR